MHLKKTITEQQLIALAFPCELPEQCTNSRYFLRVKSSRDANCGVNLTVNVGQE